MMKFRLAVLASLLMCHFAYAKEAFDWSSKRMNAEEALEFLKAGQQAYLKGEQHGRINAEERSLWINSQDPIATIISCSDSRVLPAKIFDAGLSDIFTIKIAGNVISPEEAGSVEYGVLHTHTPVVVMLGHEHCGAVNAALGGPRGYREEPDNIRTLLGHIDDPVKTAKDEVNFQSMPEPHSHAHDELWMTAVKENVYYQIQQLLQDSPKVANLYKQGKIRIVPAVYMLDGSIQWLDEAPVHAYADSVKEKRFLFF